MKKYSYRRIKALDRELHHHKVDEKIIDEIMQDGETIKQSMPGHKKAEWIKKAMDKMDALLEQEIRNKVREDCACCITGMRLKSMKEIAASGMNLKDKIKKINDIHIFGKSTAMDGKTIHVTFGDPGSKCVCTPKASKEPISITWCYCCKGHVHKLMEAAIEKNLKGRVISSACSGGDTCRFEFVIDQ